MMLFRPFRPKRPEASDTGPGRPRAEPGDAIGAGFKCPPPPPHEPRSAAGPTVPTRTTPDAAGAGRLPRRGARPVGRARCRSLGAGCPAASRVGPPFPPARGGRGGVFRTARRPSRRGDWAADGRLRRGCLTRPARAGVASPESLVRTRGYKRAAASQPRGDGLKEARGQCAPGVGGGLAGRMRRHRKASGRTHIT